MNIGKREQIVIGSISAIALIAGLHFMIFSRAAEDFTSKKSARDQMRTTIQGLKTIADEKVVTDYTSKTLTYLAKLDAGVKYLELDQPEAFVVPKADDIPQDGMPAGMQPADFKKEKQKEIANSKAGAQLDLVMGEISKLRAIQADKSVPYLFLNNPNNPKDPNCWRIPEQLPPTMRGGQLWDQIKSIADSKISLNNMNLQSPLYLRMRNQYYQSLMPLGLDMNHSETLARFGEFAPLIQRLCYADIILKMMEAQTKQTGAPVTVLGEPLTRERLLDFLNIKLDYDPLPELTENKVYFMYQELRSLNYMLTMAKEAKLKAVTALTLRGYAFLRNQPAPENPADGSWIPSDLSKLSDDELDDPRVWMKKEELASYDPNQIDPATGQPIGNGAVDPALGGGAAAGGVDLAGGGAMGTVVDTSIGAGGQPKTQRKPDEDLGYAIPIKITYIAPNDVGLKYAYEVMRKKPLTEFHRLVMRSTATYIPGMTVAPNPTSTDIEMTATMLFVPKLFDTIDQLRQLLKDAGVTTGTQAGAPAGAPPAPAPGA